MHQRCAAGALGRQDIEEFAQPVAWAQGVAKGFGQSEFSEVAGSTLNRRIDEEEGPELAGERRTL